ncbi:CDT1-like protein a chloroplastic [Zea mays]|uniref:CDT1-like protein a chloroplastic n=1 Tax=Zea mays TaxID=4577 RepID=A0A1D6P2H8_MAIZE|nr:CDT1-like protein a chloroplastic [Zea mays]
MSEGDATQLALEKGSPQVSNDDGSSSLATVHKLKVDTEDAGSKIESPTPKKLESRSKWVVVSSLARNLLEERHKDLLNLFNRMESSIRLLRLRKRMATFNNIATQVEILAKRKLSYCHLAQMKYLFREAIPIKRVLLHDEKSLCMYADMEIILVMDVVEYTSPDHSPSMAICDAFYSKLLTFLDAHHKVPTKEQVDALSKELFALSTVTGILSTLLATCVIVLTNKIYNLSEQIDAIVSLF